MSRERRLCVRGLDLNLTSWGPEPDEAHPPVFLLHGFLDCGATFQFLVDAFAREHALIAPDWRGFGRSAWPPGGYWFPDYLADLDALLEALSPGKPARLIGHSMGGNIAALYAGVHPERVHSIISIEGFGLPRTNAEQAPGRYRKWLEQARDTPQPRRFPSFDTLATVIRQRYPRVPPDRVAYVAKAWAEANPDGSVTLLGDPRHKHVNPVLYRREEAEHCWRRIEAPFLMLLGELSEFIDRLQVDATGREFRTFIPQIELSQVGGAGHMMHWEQPERTAEIIEAFLGTH